MTTIVEFEDCRLDAEHLLLYRGGQPTPLTPKVVETLVALVERSGQIVSKDELMTRLWGDTAVEESNLSQNLYVLRKALGACADGRPFVETLRGRGYRFNGELKESGDVQLLLASRTTTRTFVEETFEKGGNRFFPRWGITAMAIAAIIAGAGFGSVYFRDNLFANEKDPSGAFERYEIKRHSDTSDVTSAAISADGKLIAFSDKKNAVWLRNVATGRNVKVLSDSDVIGRSVIAISPDADHVYFAQAFEDKKSEILKMSVLGGPAQKLTDDVWSDVSISKGGTFLSFVRGNGGGGEQAVVIVNTDGSGEREVAVNKPGTWFGMWSQSTAWSPDDTIIACAGGLSLDGKEQTVVRFFRVSDGHEVLSDSPMPGWSYIGSLAWLPDGNNLLMSGGAPSAEGQIYRYSISNGSLHRLTNDLSNYSRLSVSADGKTIVSIQLDENTGNLWTLPATGDRSFAKQITFGRNRMTDGTGLAWTPDGKIVYASNAGGKWEIWMINPDGSNQIQLTENCAGNESCSQPVVSPDGQYIFFQARRAGARNIWRIDSDGGNAMQLTADGGFIPSMSKDGRYVIYSRSGTPVWTLWQVPIEGGQPIRLPGISTGANVSLSPDGSRIAFQHYDQNAKQPFQTCVATLEAERPEKCYGISRGFAAWADDGKSFYYLDHGYAGIWNQPLKGERSMLLEFDGEMTTNFAFSPDRKSLVVARSRPTQDIVSLTDVH